MATFVITIPDTEETSLGGPWDVMTSLFPQTRGDCMFVPPRDEAGVQTLKHQRLGVTIVRIP